MKQDQDTDYKAAQDRGHYRKENKLGESYDCPDHHTQKEFWGHSGGSGDSNRAQLWKHSLEFVKLEWREFAESSIGEERAAETEFWRSAESFLQVFSWVMISAYT